MVKIKLVNILEKSSSVVLSIFIIVALILAGPANAFKLNVTPADDTVLDFGEQVTFGATVKIDTKERVPIDHFILWFDDGSSCSFDTDGNPISGCTGVTINKVGGPEGNVGNNTFKINGHKFNYGYGYGFEGSGVFDFDFSVDTERFDDWGNFKYKLIAVVGSSSFSSATNTFVIREPLICPI